MSAKMILKSQPSNVSKLFTKSDWDKIIATVSGNVFDTPDNPVKGWGLMLTVRPNSRTANVQEPYHTYENFLFACQRFPEFASNSNPTIAKREILAFLGTCGHESAFMYNSEVGWKPDWVACATSDCGKNFKYTGGEMKPCAKSVRWDCAYFGRGVIQLTHLYNYQAASSALFGDDTLVKQPWIVAEDPRVGYTAAINYWCKNKKNNKSCHDVMNVENPVYADVTEVINGEQECRGSKEEWVVAALYRRRRLYEVFCKMFNVSMGSGKLTC